MADLTLELSLIMRLAGAHNLVVPCGNGMLARNFREKMRIFNIEVPFLLSDHDDPAHGVKKYDCVHALGDLNRYHFICCLDEEELHRSYEHIHVALLKAARSQGKKLKFEWFSMFSARAGKTDSRAFDIHLHRVFLKDGKSFQQYGSGADAPSVHVLDNSLGTGIASHTGSSWPHFLHLELLRRGRNVMVYNWAQPNYSLADHIVKLVRDVRIFPADVVVVPFYLGALDAMEYRTGASNMLRARVDTIDPQVQTAIINQRYRPATSVGMRFEESVGMICDNQLKVLNSLCRTLGASLFAVLPPQMEILPDHLRGQIHGMVKRRKERLQQLIDSIRGFSIPVTDYTGLCDGYDDVYDIFHDWRHYTSPFSRYFAEKIANDLLRVLDSRVTRQ